MEKTMLPILLTLIVVSTLIYGGIRVNLYLYATGVLGASRAGCPQCMSAVAPEPDAIAGEPFSLPLAKTDNVSARYARRSMLLVVGILVVIGIGTLSMLSAAFQ